MAYRHGIYGSEVPTSLVPMTETDAGLVVAFGTAPVHLATEAAPANKPLLCYSYAEAVAALGYSDDFEKYTLCEVMKSHFALFNMAPVVFVNVLDRSVHKTTVKKQKLDVSEGVAVSSDPVLLDTLTVFSGTAGGTLTKDVDYTAAHDDEGKVVITALDSGAMPPNAIYVDFQAVDASMVTAEDIVGGVDVDTGKLEGLELVEEVYPRFGLIPGILIAPGWSHDTVVAAVMKAKATNINGHFSAIAIADIPADTVNTYTKASEWKGKNNFVDPRLIAAWPLVSLGGQKYHISTQLAGIMNKTDSQHSDIPYYSPSNKSLQADSSVLEDGTEVFLSPSQATYLNGQGIVTAVNCMGGGWKSWGNRTSVYPSNTDVKDNFIPIRRMFHWVLNTLITTFWAKVDDPMNKRLIETVVNSANIWLNGLTAAEALLGGRVEFRSSENTKIDLMDGKMKFHVFMTPPSPAREIEFVQEYDPEYISTLFTA